MTLRPVMSTIFPAAASIFVQFVPSVRSSPGNKPTVTQKFSKNCSVLLWRDRGRTGTDLLFILPIA